jgi:hypothetical protein
MSKNDAISRSTTNRTLTSITTQSRAPSTLVAPVRSSVSSIPDSHTNSPQTSEKQPKHQRFVLTDHVAFRYLEEDPSTHVLARRETLVGYECYIVEQWACSRTHPTFVITTYTGDPTHTVVVSVLGVPTNEESWSPRLKVYFKALNQYHARRRETPLGILMITNLSGFPSSLTVVLVPDGDAKSHREDFFVNENLKRLGCSGRVGMTASKPSDATKAKFYQLYRASDKIPFAAAVIELVKLCQVALMLFDKLEPEYADGLLCDVTEKAINDWWIEFGTEYYNMEPHDGILGPTTVAALLGLLTGARNRLHSFGAPVGKDIFDLETTKRAIAYFQRSQRLPKSRRLDRHTLSRLHRVTARNANGESWLVPRAVKTTVAELSGKGGEMVMDMVGGKEKAGISDVETADIEVFVQLVHGARSKWLWQGKPRKAHTGDMFSRLSGDDGLVFQSNDHGGFEWSSRRKDVSGNSPKELTRTATADSQARRELDDRNRLVKKHPDRSLSHKMHDSSRGFGRIKDAVGLRGHSHKHPKEDMDRVWFDPAHEERSHTTIATDPSSNSRIQEDPHDGRHRNLTPDSASQLTQNPIFTKLLSETPIASPGQFEPQVDPPSDEDDVPNLGPPIHLEGDPDTRSATASIAGSTSRGLDLDELPSTVEMPERHVGLLLRRRNSFSKYQPSYLESRNQAYWPRHLSFSIAEDSVFGWEGINPPIEEQLIQASDAKTLTKLKGLSAEDARRARTKLLELETVVGDWVSSEVAGIQNLDELIDLDQEELNGLYYPRLEEYQSLRAKSKEMLQNERAELSEAVKEIEVLGAKLEYEINALRSKVEDVEDGVSEFERQVLSVEDRVTELERDMRPKESWIHWFVRLTLGVGNPPTVETVFSQAK